MGPALGESPALEQGSRNDDEVIAGASQFRLDVMAINMAEAVASAGGFLCDRAMAGWDVRVFLAVIPDSTRSLQILGAKAFPLDCKSPEFHWPTAVLALSASAELFTTDARVREFVIDALRGDSEVTLWGKTPIGTGPQLKPVQHRITPAALAFKNHALDAIAHPRHELSTTEEFSARAMLRPNGVASAGLMPL